ncbi:(2Fe-2S) ferredoxin domain-containing protein [Nostoc sp. CENA67]|uniref:(2Fe-2S) ferredoxin domain-containing protein n=1 Tax=Amazonocrinis nigriterrae CENA67 TaxID=2794033 RepID=A0A8J7HTH9_9NOST|nr:(2Fe-2S) ferredoxin domain-containing protein [Amazonocrinis nigriterrae]MBH8562209.1 (2Fe-2S) ferredoxin domain-containing protein [Amazonocrinis nigriterrae CENA67]
MKKLKKYIKRLIKSIIQRFSDNSQQPSPLNSHPSSVTIPTVSSRWGSGLVLVCSQCAKERSPSGSDQRGATASEDLQNWLKSRLKFEGLWGEFRVVSTSCLGVCPKGRVAVVLGNHAGGDNCQCLIVDPQSDRELLYSHIKHKI